MNGLLGSKTPHILLAVLTNVPIPAKGRKMGINTRPAETMIQIPAMNGLLGRLILLARMIVHTQAKARNQGINTELVIITILILVLTGLIGRTAAAMPVVTAIATMMTTVAMIAMTTVMTAMMTMTDAMTVVQAVQISVHIQDKKRVQALTPTRPAGTTTQIPVWNGPAYQTAALE
jgi:hypothetical protein